MTMRKILAVLLCVCAVLSVMAVVASSIEPPEIAAVQGVSEEPTTTAAPTQATTEKSTADKITEGWEKVKPYFDLIYKFFFQGFSQVLVVGFQWLLSIAGLA